MRQGQASEPADCGDGGGGGDVGAADRGCGLDDVCVGAFEH